jgi:hypothetical protein
MSFCVIGADAVGPAGLGAMAVPRAEIGGTATAP